jgi:hypothetical protein
MRTLLALLLSCLPCVAVSPSVAAAWTPWGNVWGCLFAWDGTLGVNGNFTNYDLSLNGHTMSATSHQPSSVSQFVHGQNVNRYTNQNQYLTCTPFLVNSNNFVVVVAKQYGTDATNINIYISNSATNNQLFKVNSGAVPTQFQLGQVTGSTGSAWSVLTTNNFFVGTMVNSNGSIFFRTNGVSAGGTNQATGQLIGNVPVNSIGNVIGTVLLTADVGTIIGFSQTNQLPLVESKLGRRFAIPGL